MSHRIVNYVTAKATDCRDHEGKKILNFRIRTTDGTDENYASKRAEAKGTSLTEELIAFSIQSYERVVEDGKTEIVEIKQPFDQFTNWSTKARNFVVAAWKRLSTPDETEIADFFASASRARKSSRTPID